MNASVVAPNGSAGQGVDASVVETPSGSMLELTTGRFAVEARYYRVIERDGIGRREEIAREEYDPANPDHQRVVHRTIGVTVTTAGEYPLDTRTPAGDEPLLYGEDTVTRRPTDCQRPYETAEACFGYDAPVSLDYEGPDNVSVEGSVAVTGRNEWFAGSGTGNGYTDRVRFAAVGPQAGWVDASGYTEAGRGRYPSPAR